MGGCLFRDVEKVCENHSSPIVGDIILEGLTSGRFCKVALVDIDNIKNPAVVARQLLRQHARTERKGSFASTKKSSRVKSA